MRRANRRKYHYLYKITCNVTGRYYIGMHSTDNLEDGYKGSGKRLWYSIKKHGIENHKKEILEFLSTRKELKDRERSIINEDLLNDKLCMNIKVGGEGGFSKEESSKGAINANKINWKNPDFIKKMSKMKSLMNKKMHAEGKLKSPDWTGKRHNELTKKKISIKASERTGSLNSQYGTCWIHNLEIKKSIKIKKADIQHYLNNGWLKGRIMNFNAHLSS